jgi:hypothetical protein
MSGFRTEADASVSAAATMTTAMDEFEQQPIRQRRRKHRCSSEHAPVANSAKLLLAPDDEEASQRLPDARSHQRGT